MGVDFRTQAIHAGYEPLDNARVANPTVDALEKRLAALEGGIGAVAVGSGMAAAY